MSRKILLDFKKCVIARLGQHAFADPQVSVRLVADVLFTVYVVRLIPDFPLISIANLHLDNLRSN